MCRLLDELVTWLTYNLPAAAAADAAAGDTGPFLLTLLLMDLLSADKTSRSRVINVSSHGHGRAAPLNLDDVMLTNSSYNPWIIQYPNSKLATLLFTRELARRLGEYTALPTVVQGPSCCNISSIVVVVVVVVVVSSAEQAG